MPFEPRPRLTPPEPSGLLPHDLPAPGARGQDWRQRPTLDLGSDADRQILADALSALLRERSSALQIAERIARASNRPGPDPRDFGLTDILRLSRQLDQAQRA